MLKVLFLDIETAPNLAYVWGKYEQDVIDFEKEWYILCFGYKWLGEKKVRTHALPDFSLYKKDRENDRELVRKLWELFDEADVICAHNGDRFDIKKCNSRFVFHGMNPPSPAKSIDTVKIARNRFGFNSNKLDDLGRELKLGRKIAHTGFHMWKGCLDNVKSAWKHMRRYNAHDVRLLEKVYLKLRSWAPNHPILNFEDKGTCEVCGSGKIQSRGKQINKNITYRRYQCQGKDCGHWMKGERIK